MHIVLGGTAGLGRDIATELRSGGEDVRSIGSSYTNAEHQAGWRLDLKDQEACTQFSKQIGNLAVQSFWWVAGKGYKGDFALQTAPEQLAAANFSNVLPIVKAVWLAMLREDRPANLVVVSSSTGLRARPDEAVYAGTKHAQVGFARSLGLESGRLKSPIKVTLFEPGGMKSGFWAPDELPPSYDTFMETADVARYAVGAVKSQQDYFQELAITPDVLKAATAEGN